MVLEIYRVGDDVARMNDTLVSDLVQGEYRKSNRRAATRDNDRCQNEIFICVFECYVSCQNLPVCYAVPDNSP